MNESRGATQQQQCDGPSRFKALPVFAPALGLPSCLLQISFVQGLESIKGREGSCKAAGLLKVQSACFLMRDGQGISTVCKDE